MATLDASLAQAYAACEALARAHYENFPVASRLLPGPMRPHVAAVYAFARVADDMADEGNADPAARRAALDRWRNGLHRAVAGDPLEDGREPRILRAIAHSIRALDLPIALFDDLISAFTQDTTTNRYESWDDLLDYCRRSANPVGRLVLRIAGYRAEELDRSSDALCSALQLTNFWQDFGRDFRAGRLYVPARVSRARGAEETALAAGTPGPEWSQAVADCVTFTRGLFDNGRPVCDRVAGRLGLELRLTWLGGSRILDLVERGRDRLLSWRPALALSDVPSIGWNALRWRRTAAGGA